MHAALRTPGAGSAASSGRKAKRFAEQGLHASLPCCRRQPAHLLLSKLLHPTGGCPGSLQLLQPGQGGRPGHGTKVAKRAGAGACWQQAIPSQQAPT